MKDSFRQSMAWFHAWVGLVTGWVLFFIFLMGTASYFRAEVSRWMNPLEIVNPVREMGGLTLGQKWLAQHAPDATRWGVNLPSEAGDTLGVAWTDKGGERHYAHLDPHSGIELERRPASLTGGGTTLYLMHFYLHYMPIKWGRYIVGVCAMLMLIAILTGIITHKKIFKDFFTFRPRKGQRSWLDAHNLVSVLALPFFVMITWSGLVFYLYTYMPAGLAVNFSNDRASYQASIDGGEGKAPVRSEPAPMLPLSEMFARAEKANGAHYAGISIELPNDAKAVAAFYPGDTQLNAVTGELITDARSEPLAETFKETLGWLHIAHFAGPLLRWLFFASGLLGCGMIATGLILWTVKRRQKQAKAGKSDFGFRLVEALNVGTIAGLPTAVASYFWANRLLPLDLADRADWEIHCLFIAWGTMLLWASIRAPGKAWVELLSIAAAAFGLLPILNALTSDKHLGITIAAGDWALAGFDLTTLAIGVLLTVAAFKVHRKWSGPAIPARRLRTEAAA